MRLLALLSLLLSFISCEEKSVETVKKIRPIKFSKVEQSTGLETHTFSGVAKAQNETNLSFKVAGTLSAVKVELGDRVKKGQLIATIDPVDYNLQTNQAITQKEGSVANAEAAEAQFISSQSTYDRVAKLYENNSVSLSEYQQAKAALDAAEAQYEAANSQITSSDQQVQAAGNQVSYTRLVSPMNGVVTAVQVESNEMVNSGKVIATVSSLGRPEVEVGVPEIFINKIKKGQQVNITLPSSPGQIFEGIVDQVAYASGSSPTYPVIVDLGKSVEQIRPGMAANVEFIFSKNSAAKKSKMTVPVEAVGKDNEGNFVFVLNKKSDAVYVAEKKVITVGELLPEGFELISGLKGGEMVATAGLKSLMNGSEVKLLNE
ncbi:MAG: efflux RND transporter periplasmic adaptor subunit [Saprospiraceae bacterium]|jgi:RND family efflux transporter MFP subunit|nr:efflux RND transporter periplasmic adaptor subunit [Saprospiraceae bacterium]